ncbi:MAG: hypothetical protein JJT95_00655 [Pararhodobacter sp.]|nr:hypothetical protein [Pararhodobacter sp.]
MIRTDLSATAADAIRNTPFSGELNDSARFPARKCLNAILGKDSLVFVPLHGLSGQAKRGRCDRLVPQRCPVTLLRLSDKRL